MISGTTIAQTNSSSVILQSLSCKTQCGFIGISAQLLVEQEYAKERGCCGRKGKTVMIMDGRVVDCATMPSFPYTSYFNLNPKFPGMKTITAEQIEKMPYINIEDIISLGTNTYQQRYGSAVQMSGAR